MALAHPCQVPPLTKVIGASTPRRKREWYSPLPAHPPKLQGTCGLYGDTPLWAHPFKAGRGNYLTSIHTEKDEQNEKTEGFVSIETVRKT